MSSSSVDRKCPPEKPKFRVEHDRKQQKFYIQLEKGDEAVLEYQVNSKGEANLLHTGVPAAYKGHGLAKLLAVAALDHFAGQGIPMRLQCSYLQRHAKLFPHPEHQKFILPQSSL